MTDIVEGFRKVVQDLLVPELKAVQVEVKHINERLSALEKRVDILHEEMNKRFEFLHQEMVELKIGQKEILAKLDLDKRITKLEALMDQMLKKVA